MSCDKAFASKLTTPFVALAHFIHNKRDENRTEMSDILQKQSDIFTA